MFRRKKILIFGGAVLTIALIAFLAFGRKSGKSSYTIESAKFTNMEITVSASGEIKAERDATLTFQTSGMLSWVGVKKNDKVKKWQAIASLDKQSLKKSFEKYMNLYMTNRWDFEQTQDNYKETKEKKLITDAIQRILDKTQFSLNNAVLDVEISDLAVRFATIYSPFDGIVVSAFPQNAGINVTPASSSYHIVDPSSIYFDIQVDETDVAKISVGNKVNVTIDAFADKSFMGEINKIDFNSTVTSGGGTAYNVFVSLTDDSLDKLRLGMNGDATIIVKKLDNVLTVPLSAVFEQNGKNFIWKVTNNKAVKTEVKTGSSNNETVQIIFGLSDSDLYVSSGTRLIKEGMKLSK